MIKIMMKGCAERDFNFINNLTEIYFYFPKNYPPNARAHRLNFSDNRDKSLTSYLPFLDTNPSLMN
jgi:hypothetical protein